MDRTTPNPPDRGHLLTEQISQASSRLDTLDAPDILSAIADADATVASSVRARIDDIGAFVALAHPRFARGGRLIYVGAGTSGRLGVLDASECPPTFQSEPGRVIGMIAGGDRALRESSEHKEDVRDGARNELDALRIGPDDTLLGIAAGGTTPYVLGAVDHAKSCGCATGLLVCTPIEQPESCDVLIAIETGPEVVAGSTRMKAGTATKMALNMITTTLMILEQKTLGGLMVDLRATNDKLRDRAARIVAEVAGTDRHRSFELLDEAGGHAKVAAAMGVLGIDADRARRMLDDANGSLRRVIGSGGDA